MNKIITITVDTNDGDYLSKVSEATEDDVFVVRVIAAEIRLFQPYKVTFEGGSLDGVSLTHNHNWPEGDCCRDDMGEKTPKEIYDLTDEQLDIFNEFIPYSEFGFHTIESISLAPKTEIENLL